MSNLDKLNKITSGKTSAWLEEAKWREANESWLSFSFDIAVRVLDALRTKGMTQKDLAEKMGVSPQFVNKIIKGQENLSLETITKLGAALGIKLIEVASETVSEVVYDHEQAYEVVETYRQTQFAKLQEKGCFDLITIQAYQAKGQLQYKQANGN